jgi:hypothetical protein
MNADPGLEGSRESCPRAAQNRLPRLNMDFLPERWQENSGLLLFLVRCWLIPPAAASREGSAQFPSEASLYPRNALATCPWGLCRTALAETKQVWYGPACDWPAIQPALAISIHVVTPRCLRNLSPHDWLPPPLVPALSFSLSYFNLLRPTPIHHLPHSNHQIPSIFVRKCSPQAGRSAPSPVWASSSPTV